MMMTEGCGTFMQGTEASLPRLRVGGIQSVTVFAETWNACRKDGVIWLTKVAD